MPVFALLALVAYSVSLALIIPGLLQKNSSWRRMAILSATIALICHAFALEARIFPGGESGQNLSLLNVGSLVSLMICTVMTIVASRLAAAAYRLCLRADQPGLRHIRA